MKMVVRDSYYERRYTKLAPIMTNVGHWYQLDYLIKVLVRVKSVFGKQESF